MARIQLPLPERVLFETELIVRVSDLNYGAHLGHDAVLSLLQESRVLFYRSLGFRDEVNMDGNVGQIIADVCIQYKSEAFLGDVLHIELGVTDITRAGFDMLYRITNKTTGKEVARAKTGIVCFDYHTRKVVTIPPVLLKKIANQPADRA